MPIDPKTLEAAINNPGDIRFDDAIKLALQMGWILKRVKGSHHVFHHPKGQLIRDKFPQPLNFQRRKDGKAIAYQVREMLEMAREMRIIS